MKAYLIITGAIFSLMAFLHVWKAIDEWSGTTSAVQYAFEAGLGVVAAALGMWAWGLLRLALKASKVK